MKLQAKTINEFSKEIHSVEVHSKIQSFAEIEDLTLEWLKKYTFTEYKSLYRKLISEKLNKKNVEFSDFISTIDLDYKKLINSMGNNAEIEHTISKLIIDVMLMAMHYDINIIHMIKKYIDGEK